MSTAYYYFAASLPTIRFGDTPPQSAAEFLDDCQRLLSPKDFSAMSALVTGEGTASDRFVCAWRTFQHGLRNTMAHFRAEAANRDPLDHIRGEFCEDPRVVDLLTKAAQAPNPLAGETGIARGIWAYLDELGQGHHFDLTTIMIYGLQLTILERFSGMTPEAGDEQLNAYRKAAAAALQTAGRP